MQLPDEKKDVIISILIRLRSYKRFIGEYDKSALNENLNYSVKLTSGRIELSHKLVHDFEQSPEFVTEELLQNAASKFIPAQGTITQGQFGPSPDSTEVSYPKKEENSPVKKTNSSLKRILILITIIVLSLIGYFIYSQMERQSQTTEKQDEKAAIRNNITSYVRAERNEYTYNKSGGIYNLKITVTNNTAYIIDNVRVKVSYLKTGRDIWKEEFLDFNMIEPETKVTLKAPDSNRGTGIEYEIVSIKSNALELY